MAADQERRSESARGCRFSVIATDTLPHSMTLSPPSRAFAPFRLNEAGRKKGHGRMYIYIVGRPHSGSTILDIVLGNSSNIEGIGQLVSGMGKPHDRCA